MNEHNRTAVAITMWLCITFMICTWIVCGTWYSIQKQAPPPAAQVEADP